MPVEPGSCSGDRRPHLVFFTEERSGPARRMESLLAQLAVRDRERIRVTRIDVERRPELARRFRVAKVPTLVLVVDRRVVGRLEGRASAPRIRKLIDPHLARLAAAA